MNRKGNGSLEAERHQEWKTVQPSFLACVRKGKGGNAVRFCVKGA